MKVTIEVNGKPVEIELTVDQVAAVKKSTQKITDRIKSFEDACEVLGVTDGSTFHPVDRLKTIITALNEGWKPDWQNNSQYKWTPYFKHNGKSFVFYVCDSWSSNASVGSRLCFKSRELAEYCAKQFIELYNEFLG